MATDRLVVLTIVLYILQSVRGEYVASLSDGLDCYKERFNFTERFNVSISGQGELDDFANNLATNKSDNKDRCIQLILTGKSYSLDVIKVMGIKLGTNGGLVIVGVANPRVTITSLEQLINRSALVANVLLVVLNGLLFAECPVPVVLEEVSIVIVQNCVFM